VAGPMTGSVKPIVLLRQSPQGDGFRCALPILL
jgi:hypothetical protein